ncbi:MAG: phage minor tail protein L, partial [Alphaproteobacteria bacterium]|nr:phage minor tail protein L [Alphaproteobacteria bacterium]
NPVHLPGRQVLRFTKDAETAISFGGKTYQVLPVVASGFAWNDRASPAPPSLSIANANGLFTGQLDHPDLIGQRVVRLVTFAEECDAPLGDGGGSSFAPECWMIDRLARLDAEAAVFDLVPEADLAQKSLPSKVMLRDLCQHRYRVWDDTLKRFDYANATCPYTAPKSFDADGNPVTGAKDQCNLTLETGCKKRFQGVLPFLGFPGIGGF